MAKVYTAHTHTHAFAGQTFNSHQAIQCTYEIQHTLFISHTFLGFECIDDVENRTEIAMAHIARVHSIRVFDQRETAGENDTATEACLIVFLHRFFLHFYFLCYFFASFSLSLQFTVAIECALVILVNRFFVLCSTAAAMLVANDIKPTHSRTLQTF